MSGEKPKIISSHWLKAANERHSSSIHGLLNGPLPRTLDELVDTYTTLGHAVSTAEATLVCALDAVDPETQLSQAERAPYRMVIHVAFQLLRESGAMFARLDGPFSQLVHGGGGWPNRPIQRGDLTLYENTFKTRETLSPATRRAEYQVRVDTFLSGGGDFADITLLTPERLRSLKPWSHFDYVMLPNYELRVYPTAEADRDGKPKAGHSLLIGVGPTFEDRHILSAGELWILKDYTGELEALIIANNSGHFKPSFKDLPNTIPGLERLGVCRDQIVLFGGPNNIPAIFREITETHGVKGLHTRLPPGPAALIESWAST